MLDPDRILKLRLVIARYGEMDVARWWNTKGQLGRSGAFVLKRSFSRTYRFAQARSVFAVAAQRCQQVFDPPNCITLWKLPEAIEEEFEASWERWLDRAVEWEPFFARIESLPETDLLATMRTLDVVTESEIEAASRLRRSAEGRAVPIASVFSSTNTDIAMLALGFARGELGELAVPYARMA